MSLFVTEVEARTARKRHVCTWCGCAILPGTLYAYWRYANGGDGWGYCKMHSACWKVCGDEVYDSGGEFIPPLETPELSFAEALKAATALAALSKKSRSILENSRKPLVDNGIAV